MDPFTRPNRWSSLLLFPGMEGSRPGGRRIEITGRAWHGYPTSTCSEDVDPEGLPMASVVEGMEVKELPNSSDGDRMARARSSIGREFDVLEVPQ